MREALSCPAPGLVPRGAEFAAAPNIGNDTGAASLQPELADRGVVIGQLRNAEAAIARKMNRSFAGFARWRDLNIGYPCAVGRDCLVASDDEVGRIESLRRPFKDFRSSGRAYKEQ